VLCYQCALNAVALSNDGEKVSEQAVEIRRVVQRGTISRGKIEGIITNWSVFDDFSAEASVRTGIGIIAAQDEQLVLVGRLTPGGDVGVGATIAARKVLTQ